MKLMRDLVGETLSGRYTLVARIAGGGMGDVYRGHDLLLDRPVAVKILQPSLAVDEDLVARFKEEARAAARLNHPNIVSVYDWGAEDDRTYYMVMEYVPGTDLRDVLLARGPLKPAYALEIVAAVCEALGAAHAGGLVHRDVKPENVLITRAGSIKVADFGIAAVADAERTAPGGNIPGTLRYLSPEQARGEDATRSSDIWGAGILLFELLTGRPPQHGAGQILLDKRAVEPVEPPSSLEPSIPRDIDDIVLKSTALDPVDRFAHVLDMAQELRVALLRLPAEEEPIGSLLEEMTTDIQLPGVESTSFLAGRRRKKKTRLAFKVLGIILVLGLLAFGGMKGLNALTGPVMVEVPSVVGLTKGQARAELREAGLKLEVVERQRDPDVPKGEVMAQDPAFGNIEEGSAVGLTISAGPPLVEVPDLIGLDTKAAGIRLRAFHLELGETSDQYSDQPVGTIIKQDPEHDPADGIKLEWGEPVDVVISMGPQPATVPDVTGEKVGKATKILEDAGFVVVVVDSYSNDVPVGEVISTEPAGVEVAPEGSEVKLYVSVGPEFEKLRMPDVRGWTIDDAKAKLLEMGLRVSIVQSCGGGGTIVSETQPLPGTTVHENDLVDLFTC